MIGWREGEVGGNNWVEGGNDWVEGRGGGRQ